ncbi:MAG: phage protein Gp27 family protein [Sphingopyxis solisilvae]|uniref:phage protein Gp27 family protein n=1 Tax=Sphingopyxis solisilvae TaxID=1886788 RepID=UPI004035840B
MGASEGSERREGRGRLSSIDMLPEEAEPDIIWALEQLRERSMPSKMIREEFNARLADRGIAPVSKSAWGRYSVRKAHQFRKLDEVQRISRELASSLGTDGPDAVTVMVAEMVKIAAFKQLEIGEVGSKDLMQLARALSTAVTAQKTSAAHRREMEAMRDRVGAALDEAGKKLAAEPGNVSDPAALLKRIREDVYGIFTS